MLAPAGSWIVCQGSTTKKVCSPRLFADTYDIVDDTALALSAESRTTLATILGLAALENEKELVGAIGRLARLSIGTVDVDFSPAQWVELRHRADKRGISVQALVKQIVDKITQDIWSH